MVRGARSFTDTLSAGGGSGLLPGGQRRVALGVRHTAPLMGGLLLKRGKKLGQWKVRKPLLAGVAVSCLEHDLDLVIASASPA